MTTQEAQSITTLLDDIGVKGPHVRDAGMRFADRTLRECPGIDRQDLETMVECYCRGWDERSQT